MANYKSLDAWKRAMEVVKEIYLITATFPKEEVYGLTSQMKRAAVSIPSNIAEGVGRQYKKDTLQFLYISRGSIYELETLLDICVSVEIITQLQYTQIAVPIEISMKVLSGLIRSVESRTDLK
jgi:four helix bundle protein